MDPLWNECTGCGAVAGAPCRSGDDYCAERLLANQQRELVSIAADAPPGSRAWAEQVVAWCVQQVELNQQQVALNNEQSEMNEHTATFMRTTLVSHRGIVFALAVVILWLAVLTWTRS